MPQQFCLLSMPLQLFYPLSLSLYHSNSSYPFFAAAILSPISASTTPLSALSLPLQLFSPLFAISISSLCHCNSSIPSLSLSLYHSNSSSPLFATAILSPLYVLSDNTNIITPLSTSFLSPGNLFSKVSIRCAICIIPSIFSAISCICNSCLRTCLPICFRRGLFSVHRHLI